MVRKAIVCVCTVLVLALLMGISASAQTAPSTSTDSSKATKTTTTKTTTTKTTTTKTSTKKGQTCGGIGGLKCPEGQACRYPVNQCNVADLAGICVKVKDTCPKGGAKVCGCDGTTYNNECELLKAGVREAHKGACAAATKK